MGKSPWVGHVNTNYKIKYFSAAVTFFEIKTSQHFSCPAQWEFKEIFNTKFEVILLIEATYIEKIVFNTLNKELLKLIDRTTSQKKDSAYKSVQLSSFYPIITKIFTKHLLWHDY